MELLLHIKLDVELVARRLLPAALFGGTASDEMKAMTHADLARGIAAVGRIIKFDPYAAGADLTLADFYTFYCFGLSDVIYQKMFEDSLIAQLPGLSDLMARLAEHPSIARVEADKAG